MSAQWRFFCGAVLRVLAEDFITLRFQLQAAPRGGMVASAAVDPGFAAHALLNLGREASSSDSDEGACAPDVPERAAPLKRSNPLVEAPASMMCTEPIFRWSR